MITINTELCIGCGCCVRGCSMGVLGKGEKTAQILPRRRCIGCGHCVAACPTHAISFEGAPGLASCVEPPEEPVERLVISRRSIRHFQDKCPDREILQWALDRANYAPSGKNFHATGWTLLYGKAATDELVQRVLSWCDGSGEAPELRKLYNRGTNLITCGAPCVLIGWSPDDCLNPVVDTAVAMTTVDLLLRTRGISSCWGGYLVQILTACDALRRAAHIPDGSNIRCALMIGYAGPERYPNIPIRPAAKVEWLTEFGEEE